MTVHEQEQWRSRLGLKDQRELLIAEKASQNPRWTTKDLQEHLCKYGLHWKSHQKKTSPASSLQNSASRLMHFGNKFCEPIRLKQKSLTKISICVFGEQRPQNLVERTPAKLFSIKRNQPGFRVVLQPTAQGRMDSTKFQQAESLYVELCCFTLISSSDIDATDTKVSLIV